MAIRKAIFVDSPIQCRQWSKKLQWLLENIFLDMHMPSPVRNKAKKGSLDCSTHVLLR